jgi:tetratricopeptide (TPR) repeat protein
MIDAFTRVKDYRSAVEQHIEIINREPDDSALVDAAIAYVKRYGGGDQLLAYYQKTANEAFKNYRWNVVLARIFEANGDIENAVRQYQTAMVSQPEMTELYLAAADLEMERQNYNAALKNVG